METASFLSCFFNEIKRYSVQLETAPNKNSNFTKVIFLIED
jgi:hypothetical protein